MKKVLALIVALLMMLGMAAFAEDMDLTTFTDEELNGLEIAIAKEREARANAQAEAEEKAPEEAPAEEENTEAPAEEVAEAFQPIAQGVWSDYTRTLQEKLKELGFLNGKADGIFGPKTEEALKALQGAMGLEQTGVINTQEELDEVVTLSGGKDVLFNTEMPSDWTDWMTPEYNDKDKCFSIGTAILGDKKVGDVYTCSIEIEFKDVQATADIPEDGAFLFKTQGKVDGAWELFAKNIWNQALVKLDTPPEDGVYEYAVNAEITEDIVNANRFDLGFRCDYWSNGSFRVRNIKIEKGSNTYEETVEDVSES